MSDSISFGDFAEHVNAQFTVATAQGSVTLELTEVAVGNPVEGFRQPFSLIFAGPIDPVLAEGIHTLSNSATGSLDIYLIPVASMGERQSYQAIFN